MVLYKVFTFIQRLDGPDGITGQYDIPEWYIHKHVNHNQRLVHILGCAHHWVHSNIASHSRRDHMLLYNPEVGVNSNISNNVIIM